MVWVSRHSESLSCQFGRTVANVTNIGAIRAELEMAGDMGDQAAGLLAAVRVELEQVAASLQTTVRESARSEAGRAVNLLAQAIGRIDAGTTSARWAVELPRQFSAVL